MLALPDLEGAPPFEVICDANYVRMRSVLGLVPISTVKQPAYYSM